jgi:hypothetical protein
MSQSLHNSAQVFAAGNRLDRRPCVPVSPIPLPVPSKNQLVLEGAVPASDLVAVSKGTATEDFSKHPRNAPNEVFTGKGAVESEPVEFFRHYRKHRRINFGHDPLILN